MLRVPREHLEKEVVCRHWAHTFLAQLQSGPEPRAEGPPLPSGGRAAWAGPPASKELVVKQAIAAKTSAPEVPVSEAQAAHTEPAVPAEVLRPLDEWTPRAEIAQAELAAVRAERDGLRVRIEELQARIEEAECLEAEIREAHDELERLRGQLRREQAETAKLLEQSAREAEQLRAELRSARADWTR